MKADEDASARVEVYRRIKHGSSPVCTPDVDLSCCLAMSLAIAYRIRPVSSTLRPCRGSI